MGLEGSDGLSPVAAGSVLVAVSPPAAGLGPPLPLSPSSTRCTSVSMSTASPMHAVRAAVAIATARKYRDFISHPLALAAESDEHTGDHQADEANASARGARGDGAAVLDGAVVEGAGLG